VLVTDGEFIGGKARRAAEFGTRVVSPEDFKKLLRYIQHAPSPQSRASAASAVVPIGPPVDATIVRM
jgi:hypothetical protein